MENILIDRLAEFGPWTVLSGLALLLLRKEIAQIINSRNVDTKVDHLMSQMVAQFSSNLEYFQQAVKHTEKIQETNKDVVAILREIHTELIRIKK